MEDYMRKIEEAFEEEIAFLQGLLRIESVACDPTPASVEAGKPFGEGPRRALDYCLRGAEGMGFSPCDDGGFGGHAEFGDGHRLFGILAHLDVVPAGEGWTFAPYDGVRDGNYIYGRGTTDDKGPAVACLYAMKALHEAGYRPDARIRLIFGCDEETNWLGMRHYLENVGPCDYGFTPDGSFPVVRAEKGILTFDLVRKFSRLKKKGLTLRKWEGGAAHNMVAERARVLLYSQDQAAYAAIKEKFAAFAEAHAEKNGIRATYHVRKLGKSLELTVKGKSAHGASPEKGLNAISLTADFLSRLSFADEEVNDFLAFYKRHIGYDLHGERLGLAFPDRPKGALTFNVGLVRLEDHALTLTVNIRYPIGKTEEDIMTALAARTRAYETGILRQSVQEPISFPADGPLVKTLLDVYRKHTGDRETAPLVIGGGTYARAMKNVVAFGAAFPGDPDRMHQKDEKIRLDRFLLMTKIYAEAIRRLTDPAFSL